MFIALCVRFWQNYTSWKRRYRVMDNRSLHWNFYHYKWQAKITSRLIRGSFYEVTGRDRYTYSPQPQTNRRGVR
jgi:hypothetical protein